MAKRVRNFVDRAFSRTVDLSLLHRFLKPHLQKLGFDWDQLPKDDRKRREAIFNLFAEADLKFPADLQFTLYNLATLSTDTGAQIIHEIAGEAGIDIMAGLTASPDVDEACFTARSIALITWLNHRDIFDRALSAAAFLAHSSKLERDAERTDVKPRHKVAEAKSKFYEAVKQYFKNRYNGKFCDVRWFDEDEELLRVLILHDARPAIKNVDQNGVEDRLRLQEIVQSIVEYDSRRGAISVGSKSPTDAKKLIAIFGEHVLGDSEIFEASAKEELYTLAPIQRLGERFRFTFDPESGPITHVALREVRIDEAEKMPSGRWRRSPWYLSLNDSENALARLRRIATGIDIEDIRLVYAKIDVTLEVDDQEVVVPVTIRPPRTVSMRDQFHERVILEMLEDSEIRKRRRSGHAAVAAE